MALLRLGVICVAVLVGTSTLAGAASSASAAKISARLTKTSFTSSQAGSVKLVCKFKTKSGSFSYVLKLKKGKKWQAVKSARKSYKKGAYTTSVKKVFAGKAVKLGSYRLKITANGASKTLSFTVKKKSSGSTPAPTGSAPTNTSLPGILGTAKQGQTLTASIGAWSNSPTSYAYRWDRCVVSGEICADIGGATSSGYVLALGDVGSVMRLIVTATNAYGSTSATSSATAVVAGLPPENTALPEISGTARDGKTLTASNGSWNYSPSGYAYQWRRCDASGAGCSDISGATSSTYTLVGADDDSTVRVVVTASNAHGSTVAVSGQTLPVAAVGKDVAAGMSHSCAVLSSGKVECWGTNKYGQLGDGTQTNSATPVLVHGISNAVQVSAGHHHSCAVLSDQSVWCWGWNDEGQLGNNSTTDSGTPVQVSGLTGAIQVSAGGLHTCALLSDQTVRCWGSNNVGELGDDTASGSYSSTPVQVVGVVSGVLSDVVQVSAGYYFTCAVRSASAGGKVYCWGANWNGKLGNGLTTDAHRPVEVNTIANATDVSAGYDHACAVRSSDHSVWCWGYNNNGQLGNDSTSESHTPVQVLAVGGGPGTLAGATSVSVGDDHSCALLSDLSAVCWGSGYVGQLGNNSSSESYVPVSVSGIATATRLSAGDDHACVLLGDNSVKCWGNNFGNQLGIGKLGHAETPVSVSGITTATQVSAGAAFSCAVASGGAVWCWGHNDSGQLGNNSTTDSSTPVQVSDLTGAIQVSAGYAHACAVVAGATTPDNTVWCWGNSYAGQLGNGVLSGPNSPTPVQVVGSGGIGFGFLTGITQVSVGGSHTCARRGADNTVWCWGSNSQGQLGNGLGTDSAIPVQVSSLASAIDVSAGLYHSCAVLSGGTVRCWGGNYYGQIGNGTTADPIPSPVQVKTDVSTYLLSATSVSAGFFHSCAVANSGYVYCWGHDYDGELGNGGGSDPDSRYAVQASVISPVTTPALRVSAGGYHSCALLSGSTIDCWGHNYEGELGIGSLVDSYFPAPVSLPNVLDVSAGGSDSYRHTCAVISDGTVKCWGSDYFGQLGDGGIGLSLIPVGVVGLFW